MILIGLATANDYLHCSAIHFPSETSKILWFDAIEPAHMTLGLIPKILNPVDMIVLVCKQFRMVDPYMPERGHILGIVRA